MKVIFHTLELPNFYFYLVFYVRLYDITAFTAFFPLPLHDAIARGNFENWRDVFLELTQQQQQKIDESDDNKNQFLKVIFINIFGLKNIFVCAHTLKHRLEEINVYACLAYFLRSGQGDKWNTRRTLRNHRATDKRENKQKLQKP